MIRDRLSIVADDRAHRIACAALRDAFVRHTEPPFTDVEPVHA